MSGLNDDRKRFLEYFELRERSLVSNLILYQIRDGVSDATQVLRGVRTGLHKQTARYRQYNQQNFVRRNQKILNTLSVHPDDALALVEWAFWWERLSPEEKQAIRQEASETYRRQHMDSQPPTERQIKYLRSLGWPGEIESKLDASEKIDKLLKEGRTQWV